MKVVYTYQRLREEEIPDGITHLYVASSVKKIPDNIFKEYHSLLKMLIPSNVMMIGNSAFAGCQSLKVVKFQDGLKIIDDSAFSDCKSLRVISLPSTLEFLCRGAFWCCESLSVVELQHGLKEIEQGAFKGCKSLTEISVPVTVRCIYDATFENCENLMEVELEGIEIIGNRAFMNCRRLSAISLPGLKTCIGEKAFFGCTSLLGIEIPGDKPTSYRDYLRYCFDGCPSLVNVSIPPQAYSHKGSGPFDACTALEGYRKSDRTRGKSIGSILGNRFEWFPIHKLCYHASTTRKRELVHVLQVASAKEKNQKDDYGMSPFHIIATSAKLRTRLLRVLLDAYPVHTLAQKDSNGKTMMDYLFLNMSPKAVEVIQIVLEKAILEQMKQIGLEHWKPELTSFMRSLDWHGGCDVRRWCMDKVLARLGICMKTEMTCLLELVLWKKKIIETVGRWRKKRRKVEREGCRMTSGAIVAIPHVLDYLWNTKTPESSDLWNRKTLEASDISMAPRSVAWMGARRNNNVSQMGARRNNVSRRGSISSLSSQEDIDLAIDSDSSIISA